MHPLAQRVLSHIRRHELLRPGDRVGVAVSGGIDSVALLRLLLELRGELGIVLSVVHFNHELRGTESDADQEFVARLARTYRLEFFVESRDVVQHAAFEGISLEAAARELRYGFFHHLLCERGPQGLKPASLPVPDGVALSRDLSNPAPSGPASPGRALSRPAPSPSNSASWSPSLESPADSIAQRAALNKIVTGHTLDDQAETVLMRVIRGAGLTGLGGIHPRLAVEDDDSEISGEIVRPLLAIRRRELEQYLKDIGQDWREDSTNTDTSLTRNRVRKLVVPLLEREFNPSVAENLADLAEIARGEEDYWDNEVAGWMGTTVHWSEPEWARAPEEALIQISAMLQSQNPHQNRGEVGHQHDDLQSRIEQVPWLVANASVSRVWFLGEPVAVQRRLVKAIGERAGISLEFKHMDEILHFAAEEGKSGKELSLPLGWKLMRHDDELLFVTPDLRGSIPTRDYDYLLAVPGRCEVAEVALAIEVRRIPSEAVAGYNPDQLLDADSLPGPLRVRNWRAGDRFWPAHTKSPKKIKELLQELRVEQPERGQWPVVASGDEIVWVRRFATPAKLRPKPGRDAIMISASGLRNES